MKVGEGAVNHPEPADMSGQSETTGSGEFPLDTRASVSETLASGGPQSQSDVGKDPVAGARTIADIHRAIRESDERYRQMFEKNLAIKLLIDPSTGTIIDANPAASRFYGYSIEQLRQMSIYEINTLTPEGIQEEMEHAEDESRNYFNFRHRLASGEVCDVEVYSSPIDVEGKHLLFSIIHDITERRHAEAEIRNSVSILGATLESTADGILVVSLEGKIVNYNRKFAEMWDVPEPVLITSDNTQLLRVTQTRVKDPEAFLARIRELYDHPEAVSKDQLELKDGRVFERYSQPQWIGDEIAGRVWSFRDISDRVSAEAEIRRLNADLERRVEERTAELQAANRALEREIAERKRTEGAAIRLAAIVESSDDAIMSKDLDGILTSWNAGAQRIYGYTAEEIVGTSVARLMPPNRADDFPEIMDRIRAGVRVDHYETIRVRKDGRLIDVAITVSPMRDSTGEITGASIIARDITERKRLLDQVLHHAEEIRAEHERLANIVANIDVALIMYDTSGRVVLVNESWVRRNLISREVILGRRYEELGDNPALLRAQAMVDHVLQTGQSEVIHEMYFPTTSERRGFYIDGSLLPTRDSHGEITGAMGVSIDVTDKVQAREEVETQRALLRSIFETTPVGIVYYDRDLRIVDCNVAWAEFSGKTPDEVLGRSLYDLYPATRDRKSFHAAALAGEWVDQDNMPFINMADNEVHYYTIRYRPVKDERGEVMGILNTVFEVTESVQARQEAERQRSLLETIIEGAPVGIAFFDRDLRLVSANATWSNFVGEIAGSNASGSINDLVGGSDEWKDLPGRVLAGDPAAALDVEYRRPGETRPSYYDVHFRPMRDLSGGVTGMLVAVLDITARHELDKQKDDFLGLASHELKTPVATIKGSAQLSRRIAEKLDDERLLRMLTIIDEQSNRLTGLINELLDVTHIGSGSLTVHREALDIAELVAEVTRNLELAAPDFAFELHLPSEPLFVSGDRFRLEQVVTNLVHNAIKYSGDSRKIEVSVGSTGESGQARGDVGTMRGEITTEPQVVVSVRDYGVGIPAEQQSRVFERFFRGRNIDARHYDGLGLGLYISHNIVSEHGGLMWLESEENSGTTFYFALPLLPDGAPADSGDSRDST